MRGVVAARSSGGVSWPGGAPRVFDLDQVRALGKPSYGSFVTRYVVRLADGAEVFVMLGEQSADEQAWLRKLARRELVQRRDATYPTRDCPEVIHWIEIDTPTLRSES